jgi:hypothetical protein
VEIDVQEKEWPEEDREQRRKDALRGVQVLARLFVAPPREVQLLMRNGIAALLNEGFER